MNWELFLVTVVTLGSIFGVLALALSMQYGHGGMINFGLVAYFAAGAYIYAIVASPAPSGLDAYAVGLDLPAWVGLLAAGLAGVLFAIITGWPSLRLRGEYFALTTFAFAEVFHVFIVNEGAFGNGTRGMTGIARPLRDRIGVDNYETAFAIAALAFLVVCYAVFQRIVRAPYGRTMEAIKDDEVAVLTSGKGTRRFRVEVFLFTALFIGFAGAFYVWWTTLATPRLFTADVTFLVWIAVVLGGVGSNKRAVAGVFVIVAFEELIASIPFSTARSAQIASSLQTAALGLLLVAFLRWKPIEGIAARFAGERAS